MQSLGVDPARCIHTHPIKRERDIRNALDYGVRTFVADNPDEVRKFQRYGERVATAAAGLVSQSRARCATCRASSAAIRRTRSSSRGWPPRSASTCRASRFTSARRLADALKHVEAIERLRAAARASAARAARHARHARYRRRLSDRLPQARGRYRHASARRSARRWPSCRAACACIAEPGRYIVGPAAIGVATVMGRAQREGHWWYYLDDGLYGSYSGQLYDHARYPVEVAAARAARCCPRCSPAPPATASM